jgi:hypothetical protein
MVLTTSSLAGDPAPPELEMLAARLACHGDHEPCTPACTACLVCGRDAGRQDLLCPSCREAGDG